jgi:hypothetical protein
MSDLLCPGCSRRGLTVFPTLGSRVDYECGNCALAFSIAGSDRQIFRQRPRGELVRDPMSGQLWLKPIRRVS